MSTKKVTVPQIIANKGKVKTVVVTAYDFPSALAADQAGVDIILVGDSLAMVVLGLEDTLDISMEIMLAHTAAVARASRRALVVADMPFLSYQTSPAEAIRNAGLFLQKGRAKAIKLEGGRYVAETIKAVVAAGIPVMGHLGLTPQSLAALGGYKIQGKTSDAAKYLLEEAKILESAGCFSIVLEAIPSETAEMLTKSLKIPTIGIGAGPACDGQVLVIHDILGLSEKMNLRFVKKYADLFGTTLEALSQYTSDVREGVFPGPEHEFHMAEEEKDKLASLEKSDKEI